MPAFSVNLIVRDAAATLAPALASLQGLSDDIVVVIDSRSTDTSEAIAKKSASQVFVHPFVDFSSQRHFAATHSRHPWIFSLDADEEVSPPLADFLQKFSRQTSSQFSAFSISRKNIIFGRPVRHTNWDPNGIVRLFDKTQGHWQGAVHERWQTPGEVCPVKAPIIHHHYATVEEFLAKLDVYTTAEAKDIPRFSWLQFFCSPVWEFMRRYFVHAGFLDGFHGLFLSFLMWFYRLSVWIKVWQKQYIAA